MDKPYDSNTCNELLEILKHVPEEMRKAIPEAEIKYLLGDCNSQSIFIYNEALPFCEQELSAETIKVLKYYSDNFWISSRKTN